MKTLFLARHGKSSWSHPELPDEKRPLLVKGENNTKFIAEQLLSKVVKVDLIISSPVVRALETAKIIALILKYPEENIKTDNIIYSADANGLFDPLFDLSDSIESVMIIGHNPAMTYFVNNFIEKKVDNLPTSGVICVSLKIDKWQDIIKPNGKELFRIFPKAEE